jgi:hypothetical protein
MDEDLARGLRHNKNQIDDQVYIDKMSDILSGYPHLGVPPHPTKIFDHVYLGTSANIGNPTQLNDLHIDFALNCAGFFSPLGPRKKNYLQHLGIKEYKEIYGHDEEGYNITLDFPAAFSFLDSVKRKQGRCLIYCSGVSQSGAICIGYMVHCGIPLLSAVKELKEARRTVLCNHNFMEQLVKYARGRDGLDTDVYEYQSYKYGGAFDKSRLASSHLPLFV